jgi:nucleoside-diphosphate-sugar epimerase
MPDTQHLLTIGFGYSAEATARRVTTAGWQGAGTTRQADKAAAIEAAGFRALVADPASDDGAARLRDAAREADAILISVPPAETGDPVFEALKDVDLAGKRLIYLSTTGVYGDRRGGWAFEWEAVTPGQPRSVRRAQAEADWLSKGALSLRLGGIYGPGKSAFERLRAGRPVVDKPGQVFSRIHVDDIAGAVLKALERPEVSGPINLVDDAPSSQAGLMRAAAKLAGLPPPEIVPFAEAELTPMAASFFSECRRVSNARAKAMLGWRPTYPDAVAGLKAMMEDGRA